MLIGFMTLGYIILEFVYIHRSEVFYGLKRDILNINGFVYRIAFPDILIKKVQILGIIESCADLITQETFINKAVCMMRKHFFVSLCVFSSFLR